MLSRFPARILCCRSLLLACRLAIGIIGEPIVCVFDAWRVYCSACIFDELSRVFLSFHQIVSAFALLIAH